MPSDDVAAKLSALVATVPLTGPVPLDFESMARCAMSSVVRESWAGLPESLSSVPPSMSDTPTAHEQQRRRGMERNIAHRIHQLAPCVEMEKKAPAKSRRIAGALRFKAQKLRSSEAWK